MGTFADLVARAMDELGLPRLSSVTATDQQTRQIAALANREGEGLMKLWDWTALQGEYVIEFGTPSTIAGDLTSGSRVVTNTTTTGMAKDTFMVSGTGVKPSCRIASIDSATQFTMSEQAETTGTAVSLTVVKDTFDIPSDFDRYIPQTAWDRKFRWSIIGPRSPQFDQWERSGIVATGPRRRWRQVGRKPSCFRIFPPPTSSTEAPGTLVWEYMSNAWVTKADGSFASVMTAADDEPIFPDWLMVLGIKWRFFAAKGFDYAGMQAEWRDAVNMECSRDGGKPVLDLRRRVSPVLISPANVQDGNFPGA